MEEEEESISSHLAFGLGCFIAGAFEDAILSYKKALELSLSAGDKASQVEALVHLAMAYCMRGVAEIAERRNNRGEERAIAFYQNEDISKALEHLDEALKLDAQNECGVFADESFSLQRLDIFKNFGLLYTRRSEAIKSLHGIRPAISYLERKLEPFDYIPGTHLAPVHFQLGIYYHELGETEKEIICWKKTLEAETDYSYYPEKITEELFGEYHQMARHNLRLVQREQSEFSCRYCGAGNQGDAVFCEKCGKKIV